MPKPRSLSITRTRELTSRKGTFKRNDNIPIQLRIHILISLNFRTALFNLKEFSKSLEALEQGLKLAQQNNEKKQNLFTDLIAKCQKEIPAPKQLEAEKQPTAENQTTEPVQAPAPVQPPKIK